VWAAAAGIVGHRRALVAVTFGSIASAWTVVMAVVVVAMGGTPTPAELAIGLGIPATAMDAYQQASASSEGVDCRMRWQILAAIGRIESNHASDRTIDENGTVRPPIIGPVLDGTGGTARVADSDGGVLDTDPEHDRAVGPMQFLPSSWAAFGGDGNADGQADPNNLFDAALGAVRHLCQGGSVLDNEDALAQALGSYNHSDSYVQSVLGWVDYYDQAAIADPTLIAAPTGNLVDVRGIRVDASLAAALENLLAAADAEGLALAGGGYRSHDQQIALRRAHCGTSDYAIYEMPADQCAPPTARPGQSMHESGLAIDFTCSGRLVAQGDPCYRFLMTSAAWFGLYNLPTEPWHWSTNGR
jgi:hypothetical protein